MIDRRALAILLVPVATYLAVLEHRYDGIDYLRGDCPYYLYTATSLLQDGDLDLANQIPGGLSFHFDQVSLARDGRVVPKHPVAMPLASLPFVALFGRPGALVFNVVQMLVLVGVLYGLGRRVAEPPAAAIAAAATGTLTFLPHYVWNYSPDVFATLAVAAGILLLSADPPSPARDAAGGLCLGIACAAKPAVVWMVLAAGALLATRGWRLRAAAAIAGGALPLGAWALLNLQMFGGPQVTSYDRIARLGDHGVETYSQRDDFGQPMWKGLKRQLRHPTQGLAATSAVTLAAWLGLPLVARRHRRLAVALATGSAALLLFFSTYALWDSSHYGNRHLMPAVALASVPLAALLEAALRFRRRQPVA
jgi:4-amino-4-deoxy-L-arabinose transferase-like glycosyltransferase